MIWQRGPRFLLNYATLFSMLECVTCYPGGGPDTACTTMYPIGHGATHRTSRPPYRIRTAKNAYSPGETIPVIIESLGKTAFYRGVYLQARPVGCDTNTSGPIGVFTYGGTDLQTRHCFDKVHSTITQKSSNKKFSNTLYWTAPVISAGHVILKATFVQDAHTFWINVTSEVLRDLKDPGSPGCFKKSTSTLPTTPALSKGTTSKQRHIAHVHPSASTYSSAAHHVCTIHILLAATAVLENMSVLMFSA